MRKWLSVGLLAVVVAGTAIAWRTATRGERIPDRIRIRGVLEQGRQAIMGRDLRGAMEVISHDYQDSNGLTYTTLKAAAARALESAEDYMVAMDAPTIEMEDDSAVARTRIEAVALLGGMRSPAVRFDLVADFTKERCLRWGVFRVTRWRITRLDGIPLSTFQDL